MIYINPVRIGEPTHSHIPWRYPMEKSVLQARAVAAVFRIVVHHLFRQENAPDEMLSNFFWDI